MMQSNAFTIKESIARVSLQIAIGAATLWDYRLVDLRLFDGVAILMLGLWLILTPKAQGGFSLLRRGYWFLFLTFAVYAVAGFILHKHRSSLAIFGFTAIGFIFVSRTDWLRTVGPALWLLTCVHMIFFAAQFIGFYGFGQVIDFQTIIGATSRIMRAPTQMRASGLFQEANSYCLNLFVLTSASILWRPSRVLTACAALTMILSESLWGLGAALVLFLLCELRLQTSLRRLLLSIAVSSLVIGVFFNGYLWLSKSHDENMPFLYWRITTIVSDASFQERYLQNACARDGQTHLEGDAPRSGLATLILGAGLSTRFFQECLPANGVSLLIKSFGAIGLAGLLAGFAMAIRGLSSRAKLYAISAIGFGFTTYPLLTYGIFWLWLPTILGLLRINESGLISTNDRGAPGSAR